MWPELPSVKRVVELQPVIHDLDLDICNIGKNHDLDTCTIGINHDLDKCNIDINDDLDTCTIEMNNTQSHAM